MGWGPCPAHRLRAETGWEGKLISSLEDKTMRIWELETGMLAATLPGHRDVFRGLYIVEWTLLKPNIAALDAGVYNSTCCSLDQYCLFETALFQCCLEVQT